MIVVYQSFEGQYSDSPRAVFEQWRQSRPDDVHVWLAAPQYRDQFPADVRTVPIYGPAGTAVLESADVLVANTHTDVEWNKGARTFYLQTWHGTPLKRIHHDVRWAPEGRLARLDHDVARWDALLSPNTVSTPLLQSAFRFCGPVLETGYPRNDALFGHRAAATRRRVRRELDLTPGMTAVLYMPTWRDDSVFSENPEPAPTIPTVHELLDRLQDGEVLLYRCHSFDLARRAPLEHPRLRDVSALADPADLYLAADVMVTDYSSAMFDFAVTGKPLLHYTPDYERFRDEVRGFYFDLEQEAPGPLYRRPDDLVSALRSIDRPDPEYVARYDAFRARYAELEDGRATQRAVDILEAAVGAKRAGNIAGRPDEPFALADA